MSLSEAPDHRLFGIYRLSDGETFGTVIGGYDGSQKRFTATLTKGDSTIRWIIDAPVTKVVNQLVIDSLMTEQRADKGGWQKLASRRQFQAHRILPTAPTS